MSTDISELEPWQTELETEKVDVRRQIQTENNLWKQESIMSIFNPYKILGPLSWSLGH